MTPARLALVGLAVFVIAFGVTSYPPWAGIAVLLRPVWLVILLAAGIWALVRRLSEPKPSAAPSSALPGWYPNPEDSKWLAYWDGTEWTEMDKQHPNR